MNLKFIEVCKAAECRIADGFANWILVVLVNELANAAGLMLFGVRHSNGD